MHIYALFDAKSWVALGTTVANNAQSTTPC